MNISTKFPSIEQMASQISSNERRQPVDHNAARKFDFNSILAQKANHENELTFSKHASLRLQDRNIDLSKEQIGRLNEGARMAQEKGINESLVMMDDMAFIINIKNSTVVTALGDGDNKVITNIDGAVIV